MDLSYSYIALAHQLQIVDYITVALVVLFLYDYLTLLSREITNIWPGKWGATTIIYIVCRYTPFVVLAAELLANLEDDYCTPAFYVLEWTSFIGLASSELCFILRAYAVWGTSRGAAIFFGLLTIGMVCGFVVDGSQVGTVKSASQTPTIFREMFPFSRCLNIDSTGGGFSMWGFVIVLIVDAIVAAVVLWAKFRVYRTENNQLLEKILRDSLTYFVYNLATAIVSIVVFLRVPGPLKEMSSAFGFLLSSLISTRMMLELREHGDRSSLTSSRDIVNPTSMSAISTIQFRSEPESEEVSGV